MTSEPLAPEPLAPEPLAPEPLAPEPLAPEPLAPEPLAPEPLASAVLDSPGSERDDRQLAAACTAGLQSLVALLGNHDKENGTANAPLSSPLLPLPEAALSELRLWVKTWAADVERMRVEE
jgi:hypothetical protein